METLGGIFMITTDSDYLAARQRRALLLPGSTVVLHGYFRAPFDYRANELVYSSQPSAFRKYAADNDT